MVYEITLTALGVAGPNTTPGSDAYQIQQAVNALAASAETSGIITLKNDTTGPGANGFQFALSNIYVVGTSGAIYDASWGMPGVGLPVSTNRVKIGLETSYGGTVYTKHITFKGELVGGAKPIVYGGTATFRIVAPLCDVAFEDIMFVDFGFNPIAIIISKNVTVAGCTMRHTKQLDAYALPSTMTYGTNPNVNWIDRLIGGILIGSPGTVPGYTYPEGYTANVTGNILIHDNDIDLHYGTEPTGNTNVGTYGALAHFLKPGATTDVYNNTTRTNIRGLAVVQARGSVKVYNNTTTQVNQDYYNRRNYNESIIDDDLNLRTVYDTVSGIYYNTYYQGVAAWTFIGIGFSSFFGTIDGTIASVYCKNNTITTKSVHSIGIFKGSGTAALGPTTNRWGEVQISRNTISLDGARNATSGIVITGCDYPAIVGNNISGNSNSGAFFGNIMDQTRVDAYEDEIWYTYTTFNDSVGGRVNNGLFIGNNLSNLNAIRPVVLCQGTSNCKFGGLGNQLVFFFQEMRQLKDDIYIKDLTAEWTNTTNWAPGYNLNSNQ